MEHPGFGMKIKIIANSIDAKFNRHNAALDLTATQSHMLGYIVRHKDRDVGFQELESFFDLRHSTVTGIVQRLEEKGFVTCTPDGGDRRKKRIHATPKSVELFQNICQGREAVERELTAGVRPEDMAVFERVLEQIFHNALLEKDLPRFPAPPGTSQEGKQ